MKKKTLQRQAIEEILENLNWVQYQKIIQVGKEMKAKRAKILRERQPLTSEEFRELWNQTIRNEKEKL